MSQNNSVITTLWKAIEDECAALQSEVEFRYEKGIGFSVPFAIVWMPVNTAPLGAVGIYIDIGKDGEEKLIRMTGCTIETQIEAASQASTFYRDLSNYIQAHKTKKAEAEGYLRNALDMIKSLKRIPSEHQQ